MFKVDFSKDFLYFLDIKADKKGGGGQKAQFTPRVLRPTKKLGTSLSVYKKKFPNNLT